MRFLVIMMAFLPAALYAQRSDTTTRAPSPENTETVAFSPVYGHDSQLNDLLTHVTEWVILRLPKNNNIHKVNGVIKCHFTMDKKGKIVKINMGKNEWPWLSYEISTSLLDMPPYESELTLGKNFSHNLYFSFGPQNQAPNWDLNANEAAAVNDMKQDIASQKQELQEKTQAHYNKFNQFRNDNIVNSMSQEMKQTINPVPGDGQIKSTIPQQPLNLPAPPERTNTKISILIE